jgi:hypothetical protein
VSGETVFLTKHRTVGKKTRGHGFSLAVCPFGTGVFKERTHYCRKPPATAEYRSAIAQRHGSPLKLALLGNELANPVSNVTPDRRFFIILRAEVRDVFVCSQEVVVIRVQAGAW